MLIVFLSRPRGCGVSRRGLVRGTGSARQLTPQGYPVAVLHRVLGLSLQQGLLFRETTLDEWSAQRAQS